MDRKRLAVVWLCAVTFLFSVLAVSVSAADKELLLDELYENAQLERQLSWIQSSMTIEGQQYALPDDVVSTVNQVVRIRYNPGFFRTSMKATLDEALSVGELLKLIDWYNSDLGQRVLVLEAQANNPANALHMQAYIEAKLSQKIPRTSRIRLIEELMEALDTVELATELAASASVSGQRLLREVMPARDGRPMRPAEVLKAREKPGIRRDMMDKMRNIFLYTYRSLPDDDIRRYLEFARDNAMQNFQRGQVQAMARML